jgi:hypothetical protein
MSVILRLVVCDESRRNTDLTPGPAMLPAHASVHRASRLGEALGLPHVAVGLALEQCELTDLVFYTGFWDTFIAATPNWSEADHRLRAHRTVLFGAGRSRDEAEFLERSGLAFGVPWTEMSGKGAGAGYTYLYVRRDIAAAAGLETSEMFHSEHYVMATSPPGMSQEEMVALYMRTYWDKLGY